MEPANRRLIRPALVEVKDQPNTNRRASNGASGAPKKIVPPEQTNAENFYYVKQMQTKTPMVIVLQDGETIEGTIEWYDKACLKIHRDNGPNLLLYKPCIKYMYKA
ncbi:MAG: Hfq-like protein [Acidobacteriota bacterium]